MRVLNLKHRAIHNFIFTTKNIFQMVFFNDYERRRAIPPTAKSLVSLLEKIMSQKIKVLLLGDSIRMSYQATVADIMKDSADVVGPEENCQFSAYTLASLDGWLEQLGTPDIVHWNNGLHDVGHNPDRKPIQYPLDEYMSNLKAIIKKFRDADAKIIWATSTPIHPKRPFKDTEWSWRNEEIDLYNKSALELMQSECIPVDDLHAVVTEDVDAYLSEDMLHLSEEGIKKCAKAVIKAINKKA